MFYVLFNLITYFTSLSGYGQLSFGSMFCVWVLIDSRSISEQAWHTDEHDHASGYGQTKRKSAQLSVHITHAISCYLVTKIHMQERRVCLWLNMSKFRLAVCFLLDAERQNNVQRAWVAIVVTRWKAETATINFFSSFTSATQTEELLQQQIHRWGRNTKKEKMT